MGSNINCMIGVPNHPKTTCRAAIGATWGLRGQKCLTRVVQEVQAARLPMSLPLGSDVQRCHSRHSNVHAKFNCGLLYLSRESLIIRLVHSGSVSGHHSFAKGHAHPERWRMRCQMVQVPRIHKRAVKHDSRAVPPMFS